MSFRTIPIRHFITVTVLYFLITGTGISQGVSLYTPYTRIAVPPGKKVSYTLEIINKSPKRQNIDLVVSGVPKTWTYKLESGGYALKQISVLSGATKKASLSIEVPYKISPGKYTFFITAKGFCKLPLTIMISRQGTYKTDFMCNQTNMEGQATSTFNFNASLKNSTGELQRYALRSMAPRGWSVVFKPNSKQATSVELAPDKTSYITISVKPPRHVKAGSYKIPIRAETASTSADLTLEVVITGNYNMELTTPSGLLSTRITAGNEKRVRLVIKNTGSSALKDIRLKYSAPINWEVMYEPENIDELDPGNTKDIVAIIKADKKAIAGDYVTNLTAQTPEASSTATFRITVRTPMLMGWIGILIIAGALGSIYYLFQKYGRR